MPTSLEELARLRFSRSPRGQSLWTSSGSPTMSPTVMRLLRLA